LSIRHREPPLGCVAIRSGARGVVVFDCFVAGLVAMTSNVFRKTANGRAGRNSLFPKMG